MSALDEFRREKDAFFKRSPQSPVEDPNFSGLSYYPEADRYIFEPPLEPFKERETVMLETSTGDEQPYVRYGKVAFEVDGQVCSLTLFAPTFEGEPERFFIPFRDATSGKETYGAGRYLEAERLPDGRVRLDFNYAYSPFCAYSDRYRCPLPPPENWLSVPIRAGETYGGA